MKRLNRSALFCALINIFSVGAMAFQLPDIPNVPLNPSKLDDAWTGSHPIDFNDHTMDPGLLHERGENYNYERAARSEAEQFGPALTAYAYILKNGFNKTPNFIEKFLGLTGVLFGYQYLVEPSFREGKYTRIDTYDSYLGIPYQRTFIADGIDHLVANLTPAYDVVFSYRRQFKDPKEAILSKPYFVRELPLTAENALANMKPGDLFTFVANLNIMIGVDSLAAVKIFTPGAKIGPYALVTGGFQVMVLRLPNNKLHYKIFSFRDQGVGFKAQVGLINTPKISQINIIDNKIVDVVLATTDLLNSNIQKTWNNTFTLDYVLDLNDYALDHKNDQVAKAFDESMNQVREFDYVNAANPGRSQQTYLRSNLTNVTALEGLVKQGIIQSSRKTADHSDEDSRHLKVGNKILSLLVEHSKSVNNFITSLNDEANQNYVLTTKKDRFEFNFFYSLFESKHYCTNGVLTQIDSASSPVQTVGVVENCEKTDRHFSSSNLDEVKTELAAGNPKLLSEIDFTKWDARFAAKQKLFDVQARSQSILTVPAIQSIPEMSTEQIYQDFSAYIANLPIDNLRHTHRTFNSGDTQEQIFARHVRSIAGSLQKIFSNQTPGNKKAEMLSKMFSNSLFKAVGWGYILKLMSEDARASCYQRFSMSATNADLNLDVEKGPKSLLRFYQQLMTVDNLTNDEAVDLDLESESLD